MVANFFAEEDAQLTTYAPENLPAHNNFSPLSPFYNVYNRFARWRTALDLPLKFHNRVPSKTFRKK
jgi:hypothetical protein